MNERPPHEYLAALSTFSALVVAVGVWGGTASYLRKIQEGAVRRFRFWSWTIDVVISIFLTAISWMILVVYLPDYVAIGVSGLIGHMGARIVGLILLAIELTVTKRLDIEKEYRHAKKHKKEDI